jgi:hypothetical protein
VVFHRTVGLGENHISRRRGGMQLQATGRAGRSKLSFFFFGKKKQTPLMPKNQSVKLS